jgi:hypothetical protein
MKLKNIINQVINEVTASPAPAPTPTKPDTKPAPSQPSKPKPRIPIRTPQPGWEPEPKAKGKSSDIKNSVKKQIAKFLKMRGLNPHKEQIHEEE